MKRLIILCGQGSVGKSTYAKQLLNYLPNNSICHSIDECHIKYPNKSIDELVIEFRNNVKESMLLYDNIICDAANDCSVSRLELLRAITNDYIDIDLIIIQLRPSVYSAMDWLTHRRGRELTDEEKKVYMRIYYCFQFANFDEFKGLNFNSISIYLYNNEEHRCLYFKSDKNNIEDLYLI